MKAINPVETGKNDILLSDRALAVILLFTLQ